MDFKCIKIASKDSSRSTNTQGGGGGYCQCKEWSVCNQPHEIDSGK